MAHHVRCGLAALIVFAVLFPFGLQSRLVAQDATPVAGPDATPVAGPDATPVASPVADGITVVASGIPNPRGFTWNAEGTMIVASGGLGGTTPAASDVSGSILRIEAGCPVTLAGGFPSASAFGGRYGISDVAILNDTLYALGDGGFDVEPPTPAPDGLYRINPDGSWQAIVNIGAWVEANLTAFVPGDADPGGEPFAMVSDGEAFWIAESNRGQILRVTPDGAITRIVDLSEGHPVPTGIALAPDGGIYVGFLTAAPFTDGSSKVIKVTADGHVTDVWTGLTAVTALAVAPDGTLYALEMSTGNLSTPPFYREGTGRVVRQTGPASLEEVVIGLEQPVAMDFGPDGGLYVAFPAHDAEAKPGAIFRIDVETSESAAATLPAEVLATSPCPSPVAVMATTFPAAAAPSDATSVAATDPVSTDAVGAAPGSAAVAIEIKIDVDAAGSGGALPSTTGCPEPAQAIPAATSIATTVDDPSTGASGAVAIEIMIDVKTTPRCPDPVAAEPAETPVTAPPAVTPVAAAPAATPVAVTTDPSTVETGPVAIDIKDFAFNPSSVTIPVGTVVTWTNTDQVAHTASATGGKFNSGNLNPGQSFRFTFDQAGTFDYVCLYHPYMMGTIIVQ